MYHLDGASRKTAASALDGPLSGEDRHRRPAHDHRAVGPGPGDAQVAAIQPHDRFAPRDDALEDRGHQHRARAGAARLRLTRSPLPGALAQDGQAALVRQAGDEFDVGAAREAGVAFDAGAHARHREPFRIRNEADRMGIAHAHGEEVQVLTVQHDGEGQAGPRPGVLHRDLVRDQPRASHRHRGAQGGRLLTLEIDPKHAEVVRNSFASAGVSDRTEVRVGKALDTLPTLTNEAPFDLIFIDADKPPYPQYLEWALRLTRPGSIIVADNTIRNGERLRDPEEVTTEIEKAVAQYNKNVAQNPRLQSLAFAMDDDYTDGFTVAVVRHEEQ